MNSLEFTAKIEGALCLPKEFEEYENAVAHVTVTLETLEDAKEKKDRLSATFEKMQKANVFHDIDDPVKWRKKLTDERE